MDAPDPAAFAARNDLDYRHGKVFVSVRLVDEGGVLDHAGDARGLAARHSLEDINAFPGYAVVFAPVAGLCDLHSH